jgi:uncharacterized protein YecE (DUF72 family)
VSDGGGSSRLALSVGTSGFSYDEWRPTFYPDGMKKDAMLGFYAKHLSSVELNNTFYRMPSTKVVAQWRAAVPATFRFAVKATQRLTWMQKLVDCGDTLRRLFEVLQPLGETLGCVFYQVPKWVQKDLDVLRAFLAEQVLGVRVAFEFVHASWADEGVKELLRQHGATIVLSDRDEASVPELMPGAAWHYLRLRRSAYSDDELCSWHDRLRAAGGDAAFVFFKHEDSCAGPALARRFVELAG